MEKKSSSFTVREERRAFEPSRNLSMGSKSVNFDASFLKGNGDREIDHEPKIDEEPNEDDGEGDGKAETEEPEPEPEPDLAALSEDVESFITATTNTEETEVKISTVDKFIVLVEKEVVRLETGVLHPSPLSLQDQSEFSFLEVVDRLFRLSSCLGDNVTEENDWVGAYNRAGVVLHHAMTFIEDEFRLVLEEGGSGQWSPPGAAVDEKENDMAGENTTEPAEQEQAPMESDDTQPGSATAADAVADDTAPAEEENQPKGIYPTEVVEWLRRVATAMAEAGYAIECHDAYVTARRCALDEELTELGLERLGMEDVQKMTWENLEREIATWVKAFRQTFSESFPKEKELCEAVFVGWPAASSTIFDDFTRGAAIRLLNFGEANAMTKRSTEKLFKLLDMYEALRDLLPSVSTLFPLGNNGAEDADGSGAHARYSPQEEYKTLIETVRVRLAEAVVGIFFDLENSIRADTGKTPVPGGAVHPLTRYVMNYVKYAFEYRNTLEQVFHERHSFGCAWPAHGDHEDADSSAATSNESTASGHDNNAVDDRGSSGSPFATQLLCIMDLLDGNLETKSKLYKDAALSSIFLMNNGRYIVQKIKGSPEINELLGIAWCRKRSSDLRQYHKAYQRETWGKVLACLKDDGVSAKGGGVHKPVLKERFKSFNALMEEIHKTQSMWVVSDEQLQSELRVSISAVVIPAYRSFLGRFEQFLDPGRQVEKYIKFQPEDIENYIDELFDGNTASMARRRV